MKSALTCSTLGSVRRNAFALLVLGIGMALSSAGSAEPTTIGIMSGGVNGTYVRIAQNISDALDTKELRIITMLGKGSQQNIKDLVELDGVDLAIVQSDVLERVSQTNQIPGARGSIRYITKLYNEEIHILTNRSVPSLKFLEGADVAVGREGSGTEMTASILFGGLGLQINPVNVGGQEAIEALKSDLISAAVFVVGKPSTLLQGLEPNSGLKLMDINLPKNVPFPYFDTVLNSNDYPGLIAEDKVVSTVAVGAILAVFNWREGSRRYQTLGNFTRNLLNTLDLLKSGSYHPKWAEVNVDVTVPNWDRFKPAQEWIANQ